MTRLPDSPLFTVAFFEAPADQVRRVQAFRALHDPQYSVIAPHFTLLFAVRSLALPPYLAHVARIAASARPIDFECRCAEPRNGPSADGNEPVAHVFLLPQQGGAALVSLHDQLYGDLLQPFHRRDLPYLPHITLGSTPDPEHAGALCDDWNKSGALLQGRISAVTVGTLRAGIFESLASYPLAG